MLLHPRLAAKRLGDHGGRIMVAIPGQIANRDLGVRDARLDQPLDLVRIHGHRSGLLKGPVCRVTGSPPPYRRETRIRTILVTLPPKWGAHPSASMRRRRWFQCGAPE